MHVSIIIPVYNHAHTLRACLDSIRKQTYRDFEVTIVDDGSDPPLRALGGYDIPIRWLQQENAGAPSARNAGARAAPGDALLFCDADLTFVPQALDVMVQALQKHANASYAYPGFRFGWKKFPGFPFQADRLRTMPYIHTTALIRAEHFPGFDPSLQRFQDWDLWLTMLEAGHSGVHIPQELFTIHDTRGSMSRWLPSWTHHLPWAALLSRRVRSYKNARENILKKHGLILLNKANKG
jgi:glycosyltransferase involved in cell wall biosynthesis